MNPSRSVLITSLVPKRIFRTPAIAPQRAPHAVPASSGSITATLEGRPDTPPYNATAVAAIPPTAIWPSPPTLVRLARNAMMKPRPTRASATARFTEAPKAKVEPNAPSRNASRASGTDLPAIAISARPMTSEATVAATGTAMRSNRRRSNPRIAAAVTRRAPTSSRLSSRAGRSAPVSRPRCGPGRAPRSGRRRRSVRRGRSRSEARRRRPRRRPGSA